MQDWRDSLLAPLRPVHSLGSLPLTRPEGVLLAAQQLAIDLGNAFQIVFHPVIVLDPAPNLLHEIGGDDAAGGATRSQGDGQIPHRAVPLAAGAFAGRVAASDKALQQGTAQYFAGRRE